MDRDSGTLASLLLFSVALLAAPGAAGALTLSLSPSGADDTAQLQAALDTCAAATQPCRILLDRGVFHTDLLLVHDFRGRIRGQGTGSTIIRPLLNRQLRPTRQPFTAPASSSARYPVLLHFADGGNVELLDLTFDFPSRMQVSPWRHGGHDMWNTLHSAVLADGAQHQRARLYVERVQVTADECKKVYTQFSNVMAAFTFGGQLRYRDEYHEQDPLSLGGGGFVVRASQVRDTGVAFAVRAAQNLDVRIAGNEVRGTKAAAVSIAEVAGSLIRVDSNRIAAQGTLIRVQRGSRQRLDPDAAPPSSAPTVYEIEDNTLAVGAPRPGYAPFGADGIALEDVTFATSPHLTGVDSFIVRRNGITLDGSGNAITVIGDRRGRARIMDNRLSGPAVFTGIYLDESTGTRTRDNRFAGFSDDNVEVYLATSTERCVVIERQARVWDDGTDNTVTARELRRSGQ